MRRRPSFAAVVASDITARPTAASDTRPRSPSGVARRREEAAVERRDDRDHRRDNPRVRAARWPAARPTVRAAVRRLAGTAHRSCTPPDTRRARWARAPSPRRTAGRAVDRRSSTPVRRRPRSSCVRLSDSSTPFGGTRLLERRENRRQRVEHAFAQRLADAHAMRVGTIDDTRQRLRVRRTQSCAARERTKGRCAPAVGQRCRQFEIERASRPGAGGVHNPKRRPRAHETPGDPRGAAGANRVAPGNGPASAPHTVVRSTATGVPPTPIVPTNPS